MKEIFDFFSGKSQILLPQMAKLPVFDSWCWLGISFVRKNSKAGGTLFTKG